MEQEDVREQISNNSNCTMNPDNELEIWLSEQRIPNEVRLKYHSDRWDPSHPLVDVLFVCQDAKLGAHKLILLDAPVYDFFRKRLLETAAQDEGKRMLTFIDIPPHITLEGVKACLSYIYGKKIDELQVDEQNFEKFIDAAVYLTMDVQLLPSLLNIDSGNKLRTFVSSNFSRLSKVAEFWKTDNQIILDLCKELQPSVLENAFLDFIYDDKDNRKSYLNKLVKLRKLIKKLEKSPESNTGTSSSICSQGENGGNEPFSSPSFGILPPRDRKRKLSIDSSDSDSGESLRHPNSETRKLPLPNPNFAKKLSTNSDLWLKIQEGFNEVEKKNLEIQEQLNVIVVKKKNLKLISKKSREEEACELSLNKTFCSSHP